MGIDSRILNFTWRGKRPRVDNAILQEKNDIGGLTLPQKEIPIDTVSWSETKTRQLSKDSLSTSGAELLSFKCRLQNYKTPRIQHKRKPR